jgi:hypothetical protein
MSGKQRRTHCCRSGTRPPAVVCPLDGGVRPHWRHEARTHAQALNDEQWRVHSPTPSARTMAEPELADACGGSAHKLNNVCSGRRLKRRPKL